LFDAKMEKDVMFTNSKGRKLHGVVTIPDSENFPIVIICHGYASNTKSKTRSALSRQLLEKGIASFGFDFTGCGESEGELYQLTITQGIDDLNAAFNFVKNIENVDKNKIALLGSSFSGSVAVLFAAEKDLKVLALKSPVSDYSGIKEVPLVARNKQQQFFDDSAKYDIYKTAEKIKTPTIIVHGSNDVDVPVEQSKELIKHLNCEKKLEIIEDADHRYSDANHFEQLINLVSDWVLNKINWHN
tara:strand:- start:1007 stop:1738 length:732 start_codon:yes stop_codon:yes gene_type:complete